MDEERCIALADRLRRLTSVPAMAGFEDPMIALMRSELARRSQRVTVDKLGNVIARFGEGDCTVMIGAHVDELGLIVRRIDPDGFLRVERVGGVPERVLAGRAVDVRGLDGTLIPAVIGTKSHHVTEQDEKYRVVPVGQVYVDVGASSRAEVLARGIDVGCPVTYARSFFQSGTRVYAPAIDDRVGCLLLLELADRLAGGDPGPGPGPAPNSTDTGARMYPRALPVSVALVASVQEEFNVRGIIPAARAVAPDCMLALEVAIACDTPDLSGRSDVRLGGGPVLDTYSFHGRGTLGGVIPNPKLLARLSTEAAAAGIPIQRNVFFGGLSDASFLQLLGDGIPAIEVGIPTRYTHAPVEACDLGDVALAVDLLERFILGLATPLDLTRG